MDDKIKTLLNKLEKNTIVNFEDIPDLELYMDQLTTFFDNKLYNCKRNEKDVLLTRTMINNYTKAKILHPPNKKKYSPEHMMLLIMIYNMKSILSINDIGKVLKTINLNNLKEIYVTFTDLQEEYYNKVKMETKSKFKNYDNKYLINSIDEHQILILILSLVVEANSKKLIAEKLIDEISKGSEQI